MISIIIPAFNAKKCIIEAVYSALLQKYQDKEIIIIDDGSTDKTAEYLIGNFMSADDLTDVETDMKASGLDDLFLIWKGSLYDTVVKIYRSTINKGVAISRNKGVQLAQGEYIAFLDADDFWHRDKLRLQMEALKKSDAVICNTGRLLFNNKGRMLGKYIGTPEVITLKKLEKTNCINCSSVLVRRNVMLKYPMKNTQAHEDYLAWLMILKDYDYAIGVNKPLVYYRVNKKSKSGNKIKSAKMTYYTYIYAGYGKTRALFMMIPYAINGIRKYSK